MLIKRLFGSCDDLILQCAAEVAEVVAVTGNTNDQVFVFFRIVLCIDQGLTVDNVELDMVTVHAEVGANQICHVVKTFFACNNAWGKFLIEQSTAGAQVVHLGAGLDNCSWSVNVSAFFRGDTFRNWFVSKTSVRACEHYFTEINVAGGWQHVDAIDTAANIWTTGNGVIVIVEYRFHDFVCIVIIVAVFWCLVCNEVVDFRIALEVVVQSFHQFMHGEAMLFKYVVFDSSQRVSDGTDTNTLNVAGVVTCAAAVVVLTFADTIVCDDRKEWSWHIFFVDFFDYVVAANLDVCKMTNLFFVSFKQFIVRLEVFCITKF